MLAASSTTTTTSARRIVSSVSATEAASSLASMRLRRRIPAVSTRRTGRPFHSHSTRMASRVMPASGPVSTRSSPTSRLSSVDLPTLGRPTMASSSGRLGSSASSSSAASSASSSSSGIGWMNLASASCRSLSPSPCSADIGIGSPSPIPCASARALLAGAALALVGDQDHLVGALAQPAGEGLVERHDAGAGIDQEQHDIRAVDRPLGEAAHARLQRVAADRLPARGVEQREGEVAELGWCLAHVARHARRVVDDGAAPADQAIEQRRLADVGPADDRYASRIPGRVLGCVPGRWRMVVSGGQ